jgi:hypothetical protein
MVTLLYGDDQVSLRQFLAKLKEEHKNWEIINLDLTSTKEEEINLALNAKPFIASGRLVILENWFSQKSKRLDFSHIDKNVNIVIIAKSKVGAKDIGSLPKDAKIFHFKEDPIVFKFLDSLFAGNKIRAFYLYSCILAKRIEPEMLYYLLVSHLRRILIACESQTADLAKIESLATWQVAKYRSLSERFNKEKLINSYTRLLDLERSFKTGSELSQILPLLILELTQNSNKV